MKLDPLSAGSPTPLLGSAISQGIFPYLGGSVDGELLRLVARACGGAVVSGRQGAKLAAGTPGVLIDPATYLPSPTADSAGLFDYDDWLMRQQLAGVPLVLTDTPRIRNKDRSALHKALARWDTLSEPTAVVLPIEAWWLKEGLPDLIEEVRSAGRPVAIVLLHQYNGLDLPGSVAGLVDFISEVQPVPVIMLRCDISAIGAVAHRAFAGFVGWSTSTRHGSLPIRRRDSDGERDESPSVFIPALNDYFKASVLPAFARIRRMDLLRCDDPICRGESLLRIAEHSEIDVKEGRKLAGRHNMASTEQLARRIFAATDPRDTWWEACHAGSLARVSLTEYGLSLPAHRWLGQWLELGSPSHDFQAVR